MSCQTFTICSLPSPFRPILGQPVAVLKRAASGAECDVRGDGIHVIPDARPVTGCARNAQLVSYVIRSGSVDKALGHLRPVQVGHGPECKQHDI